MGMRKPAGANELIGQWVQCVDASLFFHRNLELVEGKSYLILDVLQVPSLFNIASNVRLIIQAPDGSEVEVSARRFKMPEVKRR